MAGVGPFQVGSEGCELRHGKQFCGECLKDGHRNKVNFAGPLEPMGHQLLTSVASVLGVGSSAAVCPQHMHTTKKASEILNFWRSMTNPGNLEVRQGTHGNPHFNSNKAPMQLHVLSCKLCSHLMTVPLLGSSTKPQLQTPVSSRSLLFTSSALPDQEQPGATYLPPLASTAL